MDMKCKLLGKIKVNDWLSECKCNFNCVQAIKDIDGSVRFDKCKNLVIDMTYSMEVGICKKCGFMFQNNYGNNNIGHKESCPICNHKEEERKWFEIYHILLLE